MKIVSVEKTMNQDTFEPILRVMVEIPVEAIQVGEALYGRSVIAEAVGVEFLGQLEAKIKTDHANTTFGEPSK